MIETLSQFLMQGFCKILCAFSPSHSYMVLGGISVVQAFLTKPSCIPAKFFLEWQRLEVFEQGLFEGLLEL